ncbi:DNA primase family protein [Phenylobacterium conjunctum]|uniref:Phage/plasmid primase, P4 family n=1 Tax=Phenylobacterium conjunctum TaxID=1298959 RepID=A0ABW3T3S1_9CAUL
MALDSAELPPPTPDNLLAEAMTLTSETPSCVAYRLIAASQALPVPPPNLLGVLSDRTGLPMARLKMAEAHIQRQCDLKRSSPAAALALDTMAQTYELGLHLAVNPDRSLMEFVGTHWAPMSDHKLRGVMSPMLLCRPDTYGGSASIVDRAIKLVKDLAPSADDIMSGDPPPVINALNGEVWIDAKGNVCRRVHRPETGMRYVSPVTYEPEAKAPRFEQFISDIFSPLLEPERVAAHALELLGYASQGRRDIPTCLFLWGAGANGKSTLLRVLEAVVGREQIWSGALSGLSADRFVLANLENKLLFVEDDGEAGENLKSGLLKKISENKAIDTRRVRSTHGTSFNSMVMPIIATNGVPQLDDTSRGMMRRLHVIPFQRHFKPEEIKLGLAQQIIETELPGVLNLFIAGLSRLRERGHFEPPKACLEARDSFIAAANPLRAFLDEKCANAPGQRVKTSELYAAFAHWSRSQGQRPPFPARNLKPRLESMGYIVRKSNVMVIEDLAFKPGEP